MESLFILILLVMMTLLAVLIPPVFSFLDWIEDWAEKKYGDVSRRKFVKWTQYISIGLLVVCVLGICITTYLDPLFNH